MKTTVEQHYEIFLAEHYTWMCGDFGERVAQVTNWFESIGIAGDSGRALDLGCGSGIQSIALANQGYDVMAVDSNEQLLGELCCQAGDLEIETLPADLTKLGYELTDVDPYDVVVCMGDTLTHLPSAGDVQNLLSDVASRLLAPGGKFVLEFRDLTIPLEGTDRLIPVRLERDQVMLAFLEYLPQQVMVNDMMLVRSGESWELSKSAYPKLRLSLPDVELMLTDNGLLIDNSTCERGLCRIVANQSSKPKKLI